MVFKRTHACLILSPIISFFLGKSAQGETLSLREALKKARENSPDIQQLQAQYNSAVQKSWLAIAPAEPSLSIMDNDLTNGFQPTTAASQVVQLTQPIGFPGRAFLNRSQLRDQADAIQYQVHALELQISVNVKTSYYNLQLAAKNIQLNADTKLAFERAMEIARRRYEAGATGQVDFLNAQVGLLSNENDLADLVTSEKVARGQLNVLLKQPVDALVEVEPIKMIYLPQIDLELAAQKMIENRNEIKAAQATKKAADKAYRLAWMSVLPDFQVTVGTTEYREPYASPWSGAFQYSSLTGPTTGQPPQWPTRTYMVGIQFTVPLWALFNERAAISGASYDRAAAARGVDMLFNQSKVALETVVETLHSSEEKVHRYEDHILPLSDQSFRLALTDYSSGRIDFQTLADTAAARRQAKLAYATAVVTYLTNYATYEQLVGEDTNENP